MQKKPKDPFCHLKGLTTDLGIYQHSKGKEADPKFGFALEDQARALLVAKEAKESRLIKIYIDFIIRAQRPDGLLFQFFYEESGFKDNISTDENLSSQESFGITLWSLLSTKSFENNPEVEKITNNLLKNAFSWQYPLPMAESLIGLAKLTKPHRVEKIFLGKLIDLYRENKSGDWDWFENRLAYANAIFPWALWEVALSRNNEEAKKVAETTTNFLLNNLQVNKIPVPVGNKGWYPRTGEMAHFDQQPIEAGYMVCCLEKAYLATKNEYYLKEAKNWWNWFWGNNLLKMPLVDENFSCHDGLNENGVNPNQGAESNICFLMAYFAAQRLNILD